MGLKISNMPGYITNVHKLITVNICTACSHTCKYDQTYCTDDVSLKVISAQTLNKAGECGKEKGNKEINDSERALKQQGHEIYF